ncbi:MAG: HAD-IB family hydrolase [Acidimicrobiales bacterium]
MSVRRVAAFDFDGTITKRDTLAPFLWTVGGAGANVSGWWSLRRLALQRDSSLRRALAKERMLSRTMGGKPLVDLEAAGTEYAATLPPKYRPETVSKVDWHREQGHELVLVTASLGVYARPAASALGFDDVIAVDLEVDSEGYITGALAGPNVRGREKERRLRQYLEVSSPGSDSGGVELWAYGNSSGDKQMLAMADHPTWIGRDHS